jgi:hypothetical protein
VLFSGPNKASAHFYLLPDNMVEASFAKELRNEFGVRLHVNFHCYLSDSIPILGFDAMENSKSASASLRQEISPIAGWVTFLDGVLFFSFFSFKRIRHAHLRFLG